jgi:DNA-binding HxlR family transcriptional regulator
LCGKSFVQEIFLCGLDGNSPGVTLVVRLWENEMRSKGFEGMACSIAGVLDALGDRWAVLILRDLGLGLSRYDDLRKSTGVTNATLSDRLKHLEQSGLIERRQYQTGPDRFEYVMTRKGRDIILVIQALLQVGDKWAVTGDAGPPLKFVDRTTGHGVKLAVVNEKTGERVRATDVRPRPGPGADDLVRWRVAKFESKVG